MEETKLKQGLTKKMLIGYDKGKLTFVEKFFEDYYYFQKCIETNKPTQRQTIISEYFKANS